MGHLEQTKQLAGLLFGTLFLLASCSQEEEVNITNGRFLIFGNSITYHEPAPEKGWNGNWGMAATSSSKDYAHQLKSNILNTNPRAEVKIAGQGAVFEQSFDSIDFDQHYFDLKAFQCDFLVINLGENVVDSLAFNDLFVSQFTSLINYLRPNAQVPVVVVGVVWNKQNVRRALIKISRENGFSFVDLREMVTDYELKAKGMFRDTEVASHPNDDGMAFIAERVWEAIVKESSMTE